VCEHEEREGSMAEASAATTIRDKVRSQRCIVVAALASAMLRLPQPCCACLSHAALASAMSSELWRQPRQISWKRRCQLDIAHTRELHQQPL